MTPPGLALLKWPLRILGLAVFGLVVYLVFSVVQVLTASQTSQLPADVAPASAVVVMGPQGYTGKLTTDLTNRLEQALTVFQAQRAPMVIVSGTGAAVGIAGPVDKLGTPPKSTELGDEIRFLEQQGLAKAHIFEAQGKTDAAILAGVAKIVGGQADTPKVILVADPLESLRLRATASSKGLAPEISPATPPAAGFWNDVGQVWAQASSVAAGRVFGFG